MALAMAVFMPKQSDRLAATLNSPPLTWMWHCDALRNGTMPGSSRCTSAPSERKSRSPSLRIFKPLMAYSSPSSTHFLVMPIHYSRPGRVPDIGEHLVHGPFIARIEGDNFAIASDQRGGESMRDGVIGGLRDAYVEILRHFCERGLVGHSEIPMRERVHGIAADVTGAISSQPFRRIVVGIEAYAEQVGLVVQTRIGCQLTIDVGEVVRDPRAEIGQRATR